MALIWTPDNEEPLVLAQEEETWIIKTVTVTSEDPMVTEIALSWGASGPLPPQFSVAVDGNVLTLTIPDFVDVFPIQEIRYLLGGVPGTCTRWADLPDDAEDVTRYIPSASNQRVVTLSVTATPDEGEPETKDYVIRVFANYSLGRDALVAAVAARR